MKRTDNDKCLISVIVPVYNVEPYLDVCLNSIVNQTYVNLEIIVINDGSTDLSGNICRSWAEKDSRIYYISKENQGLGPTRNLGIEVAKGTYIAFVDSDDWIDSQYIEKLFVSICENGADIAECDFYRIYDFSSEKAYFEAGGVMGKPYTREERIVYGAVAQWNKLSRREIWIEHGIEMPVCSGEDLAVNALLLASAKKICSVNEALYYYRMVRKGSISNMTEKYYTYIDAFQYLIAGFKRNGLYSKYNDVLFLHILRWFSRYLSPALGRLDRESEYKNLRKEYMKYLDITFPKRNKGTYLQIGSFNLMRILVKLPILEDPFHRFHFTSIISIMADRIDNLGIKHSNPYRRFMIKRDLDKNFFNIMQEEQTDYLFFDFIEERHDILECNGSYCTLSDAFCEAEGDYGEGRIISRFSAECKELWEQSCLRFIDKISEVFNSRNIIMVENYLSEEYGNLYYRNSFDNVSDIKKVNRLLYTYYRFFEKNCEGIRVIKAYGYPSYFTDDKYEYGVYPWHLNELVNKEIADDIWICIEAEGKR